MFYEAKKSARIRGLEFTLTKENVLEMIPEYCPVSGVKLNWKTVDGGNPHKPSLDRVDSTKGYTKENCIVVCWRINRLNKDKDTHQFSDMDFKSPVSNPLMPN